MPHLNSKRVNSFLIFLTLLACCFALRCDTKNLRANHQILAIVEKKTIDATAFIQRFEDFRRKTGAEDNGLTRRSVLRNLVDEEILIYEARKRQYDIDEPGQAELARIKVQELLNHFHQHFIGNKIQVNDDELKQLFINLNTKIKARHIYAPTKRQADSLFNILNHGASFEEVAQTCFNDPVLKESGGSLGYFTVDEMDPAFEEAAFSLKIGEISPPIRTVDGYSIIRVDDRLGNPLVTESEFAKHRAKLAAYWHQRKTNKMTQKYVDSLRHELKIKFNEDIIQKLFSNLKDRKKNYASPENEILNTSAQDLDD